MASVSVVGQHPGPHRLDSEPLLLKLPFGDQKKSLPRKTSQERMTLRRGSGSTGDCGSVAPVGGSPAAARGGTVPGRGCGTPAAPACAPRSSPERGGGDGDGAARDDCNSNMDCDSNRNTSGGRGGSARGSAANVSTANGAKRAHRHRDARPQRRQDCLDAVGGRQSASCSLPADTGSSGGCGGPPLERLTQGRGGVVKLARTEPPRREAWSIFPQGMDPRVRTERGEGHKFVAKPVLDWCDVCSRKITAQGLKCQNCSYTCHLECQSQVQLDCNKRDRQREESPSPRGHCSSTAPPRKQNEAKDEEERETKDLSEDEVRTRIAEYNAQVSENGMNLTSDGTYTGFIKVHLRLSRPVTVSAVEAAGADGASRQAGGHSRAPPEGREGMDCGHTEERTSFYLPSDCVKQIHITSLTTTREVIQGLLKKFMVLDNPGKFALYKKTHHDGQDLFQKLPLCEHPLLLRLIAGPDVEKLSFVLKENETGEVEWHAFSVPELQNFLVILEKEEAERVRQVEQKYNVFRQKLQQALKQHDP
ncbi:ras association domain-containing protein 5 [Pholidichthys leucotaenia]